MDAKLKQELRPAFTAFFGQYGECFGQYFDPNEFRRMARVLDEGGFEKMEIPVAQNLLKAVMYFDNAEWFSFFADVIPTKYLADTELRSVILRFLEGAAEESEADAIRALLARAFVDGVATIDEVIRAFKTWEDPSGERKFKEAVEIDAMSSIMVHESDLCRSSVFREFALSRLDFFGGEFLGSERPYLYLVSGLMLYPDSQQALIDRLRSLKKNNNDSEFWEYLLSALSTLEVRNVVTGGGVPVVVDPFLDLCDPQGQLQEIVAEIAQSGSDHERVLAQEILKKMA